MLPTRFRPQMRSAPRRSALPSITFTHPWESWLEIMYHHGYPFSKQTIVLMTSKKNQLESSDVPKPHLPALPACQVIHPEDGPQALPGSQQRRVLRKVLQQRGRGHGAEVASQEPGPSLGKQKRGWVNTYKNHGKIIYKLALLMRNSKKRWIFIAMFDYDIRYLGG